MNSHAPCDCFDCLLLESETHRESYTLLHTDQYRTLSLISLFLLAVSFCGIYDFLTPGTLFESTFSDIRACL